MTDHAASQKLVLVVEDDQAIMESLVELLEEEGFRVMAAPDGQAALEILRGCTELPSVILLDLMMPRKDGIAFREEQENDPRLASIPVILMSADGQLESKKHRLGLRHHIRKPLDLEEFLAEVKKIAG